MERKVTKLENCHTEIIVTVDEKTWKDAQKKAFDKLAANVTVAGFRKGKAPANLVKDKVNQVEVMDNAINALLPELYREVLTEENIRPFAQPKVDVTKLSDVELEVKFVVVTAPEVELGQYTGLEVDTTRTYNTEGYDAALRDYTMSKDEYDKLVADLNAQTESLQQEDKVLELRLNQIDTEQNELQTELEAVKSVLDKNIENTFKTFA